MFVKCVGKYVVEIRHLQRIAPRPHKTCTQLAAEHERHKFDRVTAQSNISIHVY
jgi:hypothetical protein